MSRKRILVVYTTLVSSTNCVKRYNINKQRVKNTIFVKKNIFGHSEINCSV